VSERPTIGDLYADSARYVCPQCNAVLTVLGVHMRGGFNRASCPNQSGGCGREGRDNYGRPCWRPTEYIFLPPEATP
jgi:hypothetical protein